MSSKQRESILNVDVKTRLVDHVMDALYDLSEEEFVDVMNEILDNASMDTLYTLLLNFSSYEIGVVTGDACYDYNWLDECIGEADSEEEALKIAQAAIDSGNWKGYTVVILNVPSNYVLSDRVHADKMTVWSQYVPEEDEDNEF